MVRVSGDVLRVGLVWVRRDLGIPVANKKTKQKSKPNTKIQIIRKNIRGCGSQACTDAWFQKHRGADLIMLQEVKAASLEQFKKW